MAVKTGGLAEAKPKTTLRDAAGAWMADARAGAVRTKGGDPLKPGTLRAYDQAFRLRVIPALGDVPFYRVRRADVQHLVDRLVVAGVAPATINTTVGAVGALYGGAVYRDELDVSPTVGVRGPRGP